MGRYCCCKENMDNPCKCDWEGWHNLENSPKDLPKKNGTYLVRAYEDGDAYETKSKFSLTPKLWHKSSEPDHWEKDYCSYVRMAAVYAWKEK